VKAVPFRGRNEGLKGHVFECTGGRQGDQFTVTMKEIAEYVGSNYSYGADIRWTVQHEALFVVTRPKKPDTTTTLMDEVDTMIFKKEVDEYVKRREKHSENCRTLFSLMLGQC
jgi:bisphosphoglycerate-independent phosphoglycerate mutase (AlkP superfamily)